MRMLLLYPALLFITGVQGHYIAQQDKPHEDKEPVIYEILRGAGAIANNLRKSIETSEIVKEYKIKEMLHAAVNDAKEIESKLEDYFDKVWKKIECFGENFPVFSKKVVPILEDLAENLEEQAEESAKHILNSGTESLYEVKKHLTAFLQKVETIVGESQDELHSKVVELKGKIQPYMDDVRDEYDRYVKRM